MKIPRPRLTVRTMIGLVAVAALLIWGWMAYFDPVRLWKAAIRDKYDASRRYEGINGAVNGQIRGITPDLAIDEFIGLLGDESLDFSVRSTAAEGLGMFQQKARRAIPALVAALRDESPSLRSAAAIMIRRLLGDHPEDDPTKREAVAGLVAALKDPDRRVRRWSACCLGWIGEGEVAIPTLAEALKEPNLDYMAKVQILTALQLSGPKAVGALPAVLEMAKVDSIDEGNQGGENGRQGNAYALIHAARFLHAFGETSRAVEILRRLAQDRDSSIARESGRLLNAIESTSQPAGSEASP